MNTKTPAELKDLATPEVMRALRTLAETGACPINPPIFGALVELGVFEKGAAEVLKELEERKE